MNKYIKIILIFLFLYINTYASPVKITLIERLTKFIEWPQLQEDFKIGVYQNNSIASLMEEMYETKKIKKLPVKVYNIKNDSDLNLVKLNLIYFPTESNENIEKIVKKIKYEPILIITDNVNDVYTNMHIGFYFENKKLKFIINKEASDEANIKISYKLLKLAKIVKRGES